MDHIAASNGRLTHEDSNSRAFTNRAPIPFRASTAPIHDPVTEIQLSNTNITQSFTRVDNQDAESASRVKRHVTQDYMRREREVAKIKSSKRLPGWRTVQTPKGEDTRSQGDDSRGKVAPVKTSYLYRHPKRVKSQGKSRKEEELATQSARSIWEQIASSRDNLQLVDFNKGYPSPARSSLSQEAGKYSPSDLHPYKPSVNEALSVENAGTGASSPKSYLGAGLVDPFDSFPVPLKRTDRVLIPHFLNTLPSQIYQMGVVADDIPHKLIFRHLSSHDPMAFEAMLALASKHRALANGLDETAQSLEHKVKAIQMVNERLMEPDLAYQDETIYSVATLSTVEKFTNNLEGERMHYKAMVHMIKERGGLGGLRNSNRLLEALFYWVDISRPPSSSTGGSLPWSGSIPDVHPASFEFLTSDSKLPAYHSPQQYTRMHESSDEIRDKILACEQFLSFFQFLRLQRLEFLPHVHHPRLTSLFSKVLGPQSTIFRLLAGGIGSSLHTHLNPSAPGTRYSKDHCCVASLLMLNIVLWDFVDHPEALVRFLARLDIEVRKRNLEHNPSVEALLWIFWRDDRAEVEDEVVEPPNGVQATGAFGPLTRNAGERSWFVTRLLRVAKRLGHSSWDEVRRTLLKFMRVSQLERERHSGVALPESMDIPWDDDELRREILGDLYSGPPALKQWCLS